MNQTAIVGQQHVMSVLDAAYKKNLPVLLIGETGCGKTSLIREGAKANNAKLSRFNLTGETTVDEFVGKYVLENNATVWKDGILLTALKEGHWLLLDEVNVALPEILFVLNSLLDDDHQVMVTNHENEIVTMHEDFRFFATMNPVDEYAGTKELNKSFLSRFPIVLHIDYPSQDSEIEILKNWGITAENAQKISEVGLKLREAKAAKKIYYTCSTRDLIAWGQLANEIGLQDAFKFSIMNKSYSDRTEVYKIAEDVIKEFVKAEKVLKGSTQLERVTAIVAEIEKKLETIKMTKKDMKTELMKDVLKQLKLG